VAATLGAGAVSAQTQVDYQTIGDWGTGFQGQIAIYNNGTQALGGWALSFTFSPTIDGIWNAQVASHQGTQYVIQSAGWNDVIPAGGSVTFGFIGSPGNLTSGPSGFSVTFTAPPPAPPTAPPPATPAGTEVIAIAGVDDGATQITVPRSTTSYILSVAGVSAPVFDVSTNNPGVVRVTLRDGAALTLSGLSAGRASVRILETTSNTVRYVGVRVLNGDGTVPGLPAYLAVGSVSEDTTSDLGFWQQFSSGPENRRADIRYIYLNGGPQDGWSTWSGTPGGRASDYILNSRTLGMIPFFVFYNIPDSSEGYQIDLAHAQDPVYMAAYFSNLALALGLINQESPDDLVGMILEPDFIGYLAQNSGQAPSAIAAATHAAYDSGVLSAGVDPTFPNTIAGLVSAINYTIAKLSPQVQFGWQINLWASPPGGWTTPVPNTGLIHLTESSGIAVGRSQIAAEAAAIAKYYIQAGILSYGASCVSIDKYGLDAVGADSDAAQDPADSVWFWNNDLWQNYLTFVASIHTTTSLPVMLWQIPVGRINSSLAMNPYDLSGVFPDLTDTNQQYEDSAPDFFLGDTFATSGARYTYFSANLGGDPLVSPGLGTVTWGSHMQDAAASGVVAVLFGAGVGASTNGVGSPPTDGYWWIAKIQQYYLQPVALAGQSQPTGNPGRRTPRPRSK
jgi:hypothetical protein